MALYLKRKIFNKILPISQIRICAKDATPRPDTVDKFWQRYAIQRMKDHQRMTGTRIPNMALIKIPHLQT